ncbi:DUF2789 domain-containing protein [Aromatoleum petrolei]|uniref:DUF2789 family protein n=1 Tax=Aromatoleum petrolei TaxID=76116 RepID=A0ABX1MT62_9RHOO|nr:DUF2789 domain-containing protein [Aromatoleum petrolei]NMF89516.1 DUF2789 family protein [Aromatoleum petrolei]QTQ37292.1 putative protein DUF2789 [Aromatoleum petrolei]
MEQPLHTMSHLFAQLGLASDEVAIERFIAAHAPLPCGVELARAPFWSPQQAAFLSEELKEDADWAEIVDQLNVRLRS